MRSETFDGSPFHLERPKGKPYAVFAPQDQEELTQLAQYLNVEPLVHEVARDERRALLEKRGNLEGPFHSAQMFFLAHAVSGQKLLSASGEQTAIMVHTYILGGKSTSTWIAFAVRPQDIEALEADLDDYMDSVFPALRQAALHRMGGGSN